MKKFIAVNQKGGVGKTITSYNLTHYLADEGQRAGLVDADEQRNASKAMEPYCITEFTTVDLFGDKPLPLPAKLNTLFVIPSDKERLREIEQSPLDDDELVANLKARLAELAPHLDYIVFDTPGSNSRIANAFLAVSDFAVIPCKIDPFSIDVSSEVLMRVMYIQKHFNPALVNFGIMANEYDPRQPAQVKSFKELFAAYNQFMFPKWIGDRQAYREAAGAQVPVWRFKEPDKDGKLRIKTAAQEAGKEIRGVFKVMLDRMEQTVDEGRVAA
jgi:chromosome partitioning protein